MRLRKLVLAVSLLLVCFMVAVRSAKADDIVIKDAPPTPEGQVTFTQTNITGGGATFTPPPGGCVENGVGCTFTLTRGPGWIIIATASTTIASYTLGEGGVIPQVSPVSDSLDTSPLSTTQAQFTFLSDVPTTPEISLGNCPTSGCNALEDANAHLVDTIVWFNTTTFQSTTDTISIQSDLDTSTPPVPEPASLILFGSGLAIAGGFLRRRRRLVTPSVVV